MKCDELSRKYNDMESYSATTAIGVHYVVYAALGMLTEKTLTTSLACPSRLFVGSATTTKWNATYCQLYGPGL